LVIFEVPIYKTDLISVGEFGDFTGVQQCSVCTLSLHEPKLCQWRQFNLLASLPWPLHCRYLLACRFFAGTKRKNDARSILGKNKPKPDAEKVGACALVPCPMATCAWKCVCVSLINLAAVAECSLVRWTFAVSCY